MRYPSILTIQTMLRVTPEEAKRVRMLLLESGHKPERCLSRINDYLASRQFGTFGVEYIRHRDDDMHGHYGLEYVNTGDTYQPTVIYDWGRGTWRVCSWGDILDRRMNEYP